MTDYGMLAKQAGAILAEEAWYVAAMSNLSALLMDSLPDMNWAGFYLLKEGRLTVGPFQGKPACVHIEPGKGVCGTALLQDRTIVVPDVHAFPGHIACDSASLSEIVVPIRDSEGKVLGVLDIDSPEEARFTEEDRDGLEQLVRILEKMRRRIVRRGHLHTAELVDLHILFVDADTLLSEEYRARVIDEDDKDEDQHERQENNDRQAGKKHIQEAFHDHVVKRPLDSLFSRYVVFCHDYCTVSFSFCMMFGELLWGSISYSLFYPKTLTKT